MVYVPGSSGPRPIRDEEWAPLEVLGARLRRLRREKRLTRSELAARADLGTTHLGALERGESRTRRSTLGRIAAALVGPVDAPALVEELVELAGVALAPESQHLEDQARTLARRVRRAEVARRRALRARIVDAGLDSALRRLPREAGRRLVVELVRVAREAVSARDATRLMLRVLERDLGPPASQALPRPAGVHPSVSSVEHQRG